MVHELWTSDVQAGFRRDRGKRDQTVNSHWIIEKEGEFQENIYFCFIDYAKAFDCVDHNELCEILKEMGIPDHLICLLRNLYVGQETTVRTLHGTTDWFKIGKEYNKAIYCHAAYLTYMLSTSCQMLGYESRVGITIARRNINNLKYAGDTTESEEELKSLLMRVKEEWRNWLKT